MQKTILLTAAMAAMVFSTYAQRPEDIANLNNAQVANGTLVNNITTAKSSAMARAKAVENLEFSNEFISEQPAGQLTSYTREGGAFMSYYGYIYKTTQNGNLIDVVVAEDGETVYLKNPVSMLDVDSWVKGTIKDGKIHLPLYQTLNYFPDEDNAHILVKSVMINNGDGSLTPTPDFEATEVTYTIHEDGVISLDDTDVDPETNYGKNILAVINSNDQTWTGFGDWQTIYRPFNATTITVPESVVLEDWVCKKGGEAMLVKAGTDGELFYIDGLASAPVVGTIAGDKVTFASNQYVGMMRGAVAFFVAATYHEVESGGEYSYTYNEYDAIPALEFAYDAEAKTLTPMIEQSAIIINMGFSESGITSMSAFEDPSFNIYTEVAGAPVTPYFVAYAGEYDGQWSFYVKTPNVTRNGDYIMADKMEWAVYTDGELYTFTPDDGYFISEEMQWIPAGYKDENYGWDIYCDGENMLTTLHMYTTLCSEVGFQSRATFDGVSYYSSICYVNVVTGEKRVEEVEDVDPVSINAVHVKQSQNTYNVMGIVADNSANGLVINNGMVMFRK